MSDFLSIIDKEVSMTGLQLVNYPWSNKAKYAMWLAQTYQMVNHSTRLVSLAGAFSGIHENDLHARFVDHAKEERGHQMICIADIKNLGFKLEDFPALSQSVAMFQIQYYWIMFKGPTSFFGYTLALESLAQRYGDELVGKVDLAHNPKCNRFLKTHAEDDQDHIERAYEQINKLNDSAKKIITENLQVSCQLYRSMLVEAAQFSFDMNDQSAA